MVGGYELEAMEIEYAGTPQGSPLLPLSYIFYNVDLIKRKIDSGGGALGFLDRLADLRKTPLNPGDRTAWLPLLKVIRPIWYLLMARGD
jgi:hypothetical protein